MKAGTVAIIVMLFCVGVQLHADSQETPAKTDGGPGDRAGNSPIAIIQPQKEANPQPKKDRVLTEEEAYDLVWNLPEVKKEADKILDQGGIPLATVGVRPSPDSQPGGDNSFYAIHFQSVHAKEVLVDLLFSVDAFTGEVSVYDSSAGSFISLDDWRRRKR